MSITKISNAAAIAAVDALTALFNVGGAGYIEIRTGTMPADVDTAATGTLLGTCVLSNPAFAGATDNAGSAQAVANAITQDASADAAGTATWFRAYDNSGNAIIDGDIGIGGSGAAMIINNADIALNDTIDVTAWTITLSES